MNLFSAGRLNPLNYFGFEAFRQFSVSSAMFSAVCTGFAAFALLKLFGKTANQVILQDLQIIVEKSNSTLDSSSVLVRMNQLSAHPFIECVRLTILDREILVSGANCAKRGLMSSFFLGEIQVEIPNTNMRARLHSRIPNSLFFALVLFSVLFALSLYFLGYLATFFKTQEIQKKFERAQEFQIFAQKIGHDIRSPVAALMSTLSAVREKISPELFSIAQIASERLSKIEGSLLTGISDPTGFEKSKKPKLEILDPTELAKEILQEVKSIYKDTFEFELLIDPNTSFNIKAEPLGLRRIFSNLFQNCVEAKLPSTPGLIKVRFCFSRTGAPLIEISDNGPGFPKEILQLQGREIRTLGKSTGNGFGIFSTRALIENWGGRMELSNVPKPQTGAQIRFFFPSV